jgi:TATA-binding protein-associated factor
LTQILTEFIVSAKRQVTAKGLAKLATPEQVAELLELYDQHFGQEMESTDELNTDEPQGVIFGQPTEGADPGVDVEASMSSSQLASNLGFQQNGNMPFLFNTVRHSGGISSWSDEFKEAVRSHSGALDPFALQWHQLAGSHAVLRRVFSATPDPAHCTGMLLADDVGLGKTIQAATVMAVLSELSVQRERGLAIPPLIREFWPLCRISHLT